MRKNNDHQEVKLEKVKTVNRWEIMRRIGARLVIGRRRFAVYSPDDMCMEEFGSLSSAEKWCNQNLDHVQVEGHVEVCCHRVAYRYWGFEAEITDELKSLLEEAAEERATELIVQGYREGELNHVYCVEGTDEEIRGWWGIDRS